VKVSYAGVLMSEVAVLRRHEIASANESSCLNLVTSYPFHNYAAAGKSHMHTSRPIRCSPKIDRSSPFVASNKPCNGCLKLTRCLLLSVPQTLIYESSKSSSHDHATPPYSVPCCSCSDVSPRLLQEG
jgi:hypothetical protein